MKWQYQTIEFNFKGTFSSTIDMDSVEATLNQLGNQGWELITFNLNHGHLNSKVAAIAILKKIK